VRAFYFFNPSAAKREAVDSPGNRLLGRRLNGINELVARGASVDHNLASEPPGWARLAGVVLNRLIGLVGGYGGLFPDVLSNRRAANRADVIFSLNDKLGIPLLLLKRVGLVHPPVVYVAVGLTERLERLQGPRARRFYAGLLRRASAIVVYSECEADVLAGLLGPDSPRIVFVPFGVDVEVFAPATTEPEIDVVSVGRDKWRDYPLLVDVARRHPDRSFHVVAGADQPGLGDLPTNVTLETEISLECVRDRLAAARVVALPVRDNVYSGATTTLLQAMAMGKPIVVSRTTAIASGYYLEDGVNCRLVLPGDLGGFEAAVLDLLTDRARAAALGAAARAMAEQQLSWDRTADVLVGLLYEVAESTSAASQNV
jgi:glycosyltransferase involved in cell wall biosynthesis